METLSRIQRLNDSRWSRRAALRLVASAWLASVGTVPWAQTASPGAVRWPPVRLLDGRHWEAEPGRAQVVVFWSLTCPFCLRHNAHVDRLHRMIEAAAASRPRGPQVLAVCRDRDPAAVSRYLQQHQYRFPVTLDHEALAAVLASRRVIPLTVLVDGQGRIRQAIPGEMFEEDVMQLRELA